MAWKAAGILLATAAVLLATAAGRADQPPSAQCASHAVAGPMASDSMAMYFRFARNADSSTTYGAWLALQVGVDAATFLLDVGLEPADAEFRTSSVTTEKNVGGSFHLGLGLKVKLFVTDTGNDSRIGGALFFKGFGLVQIFRVDEFGFQYGTEAGVVMAFALPPFWGIRLQLHPFASSIPYLGGKLAYVGGIGQRFDLVRTGGTLWVSWTDNPTPLLMTGAATVAGTDSSVNGWSVSLGIGL